MRDKIMSEQYFIDFIAEENTRIQRFSTKLANGEIKADRIFSVEQRVNSIKFGIFIANYSLGTDLGSLKADFNEILGEFPRFWTQTSSYINMVWMMSIAIMLEVDNEKFLKLTALLDKYDRHSLALIVHSENLQHDRGGTGVKLIVPILINFITESRRPAVVFAL